MKFWAYSVAMANMHPTTKNDIPKLPDFLPPNKSPNLPLIYPPSDAPHPSATLQ